MCDQINLILDDAILGKAVRQWIDNGGVREILHDAMALHGLDRYGAAEYAHGRVLDLLPLQRVSHSHD